VPRRKLQQPFDNPRSKNDAQRVVRMAAESPAQPRGLLGSFARAVPDSGRRAVDAMKATPPTDGDAYTKPAAGTPGSRRRAIKVAHLPPRLQRPTQDVARLLDLGHQ
jgi:hypothetical protein